MNYSKDSITWGNLDLYLWEVRYTLQRKHHCGKDEAENLLSPLKWYIDTGRASCEFLHLLVKAKPFMIARKLVKGGSTDEAVNRVKTYLGYESTF